MTEYERKAMESVDESNYEVSSEVEPPSALDVGVTDPEKLVLIDESVINPDSKKEEIAFINLTVTKYYYYLISILSTICIQVLFYVNLTPLKRSSESLLFSGSTIGQTKIGKIVCI